MNKPPDDVDRLPNNPNPARPASSETAWSDLYEQWLLADGKKPGTVNLYLAQGTMFEDYLGGRGLDLPSAGVDDVESWVKSARADNSRKFRASSLRSLFKFLILAGLVTFNPAALLDLSAEDGTEGVVADQDDDRNVIPLDEMIKVLDRGHEEAADRSLSPRNAALAARRAALCELLYASGLDVSEVMSITAEDYDPLGLVVRVWTGNEERVAPLVERAVAAIELWRERAAKVGQHNMWLFHSLSSPDSPLTRHQANKDVKIVAALAGVHDAASYSPRLVRRSLVNHLYDKGLPIAVIAAALGVQVLGNIAVQLKSADPEQLAANMAAMAEDLSEFWEGDGEVGDLDDQDEGSRTDSIPPR